VQDALARKAEGKPLPPEDYTAMTQFVTLVERTLSEQREGRRKAQTRRLAEIRKNIPKAAYTRSIDSLGLAESLQQALVTLGLESIGQFYERVILDPDSILALSEVGAHNFEKLKESLESAILDMRAEEKAEAEAAAAEAEAAKAAAAEEQAAAVGALPEGQAAAVPEPVAGEIVGAVEPATVTEGEEEAESDEDGPKKKKKGKLKAVVEFDPETGLTVARRKRKPGRTKDWVEDGSGEGT
jgi:hypothetical protein